MHDQLTCINFILLIVIVRRTHHSQLNLIILYRVKCPSCQAPGHAAASKFLLNRNHFPNTLLLISFNFWPSSSEKTQNYTKKCAKSKFFGECLPQKTHSIRLHILLGIFCNLFFLVVLPEFISKLLPANPQKTIGRTSEIGVPEGSVGDLIKNINLTQRN